MAKKIKRKVRGGVRVSAYYVMIRAIEEGVEHGWNRAHKHGKPDAEAIKEAIQTGVTDAICEFFHFDDHHEGLS